MTENAADIIRHILIEIFQNATRPHKKFKNTLKLNVESMFWSGIWEFYVSTDTKIGQIKSLVLNELYGSDFEINTLNHSLVFPSGKRVLQESKTVKEEFLKNEDEIELVKMPQNQEISIKFSQKITATTIEVATKSLPIPNEKLLICNAILDIQPPEFISDIRKIMVSLIEYSLSVMSTKPNAKFIFDAVRRKFMCENFLVTDSMLQPYQICGASARRMKFAINCSYNDPFSVTEWLNELKTVDSNHLGLPNSYKVDEGKTIQQELHDLIKLFHLYLRASFKVCPKACDSLLDMGFNFNEIRKALRYTGNNISEAVEYLIENLNLEADGAKPGLDVGMSKTSDMCRIIMSEPEIILPFGNPSILYACLSVMDASSFLVSSMRFPILMDLLNKILSTYYTAKCNLVMKQMMGDMPND